MPATRNALKQKSSSTFCAMPTATAAVGGSWKGSAPL
jgi:hypothetical protein